MAHQLYFSVVSTALCMLFVFIDWNKHTLLQSFGIGLPTNSLLNSLVKNSIHISPMHFQISIGNLSGPTALSFFILLSAFFTSSLLKQFTSLFTTSTSSVQGSLLFFSFINFSKYFFHLFNTASKLTITLQYLFFITLTCYASFSTLSLCLANLYNSFSPSFVSNLEYKSLYVRPFAIATASLPALLFFVDFFTIFISYFVHCFLHLYRFFMLSCTFLFHHHVSLSPFRFPNITPSTVSAFLLSIFLLFSFSPWEPFCIRCCFATQSFTIILQSHISFKSLLLHIT